MPCQGHNTPIPLKRSAPVSFKRLLGIRPTEEAGMDDLELWKHMAKALSQICDAVNLLRKPDRIHAPAIVVWREDFGELAPSGPCRPPRARPMRRGPVPGRLRPGVRRTW